VQIFRKNLAVWYFSGDINECINGFFRNRTQTFGEVADVCRFATDSFGELSLIHFKFVGNILECLHEVGIFLFSQFVVLDFTHNYTIIS
jgi:hypothetical protein